MPHRLFLGIYQGDASKSTVGTKEGSLKDRRPAGLHAMGRERYEMQGYTPVLVATYRFYPLPLPCSAKACTQYTVPELGEDSRRPNLGLAWCTVD